MIKLGFFIGLSIILAISLVYVIVEPLFTTVQEKEGVRPKDGISVTYSDHIDVNSMAFYFVTTRDPNLIELRFNTHRDQDVKQPGMVAIYFPYNVTLDKSYNSKYVDYSTWHEEDYLNGKIFVKYLDCPSEDDCNLNSDDQIQFTLEPGSTFDSLNTFRHSVKIKFDNPGGKGYEVIKQFEDSRNLVYGFDEIDRASSTIIIDEKADNIHTLPASEPGIFHNSGNDYSNTQLDWKLEKSEHVFFVDYDMPDERQAYETRQNTMTTTSIILGLSGIAISILYGRTKK